MDFLLTLSVIAFSLGPLVLLIVLLIRTSSLARRIENLETHLGLRARTRPETPAPAPGKKPQAGAAESVPLKPVPSAKGQGLEALIGGRILNRIGAFALVLGVGFFLKYAFDNEWITETTRVLIGIVCGLLCLYGGFRGRQKGYMVFAQGLVGAGIAILYLSLYASFNFYQLIPQWVAFALMSGVTVLTLVQAVAYNSLAVGILGWAGGFLTPFLLSTGESNEIALFTYVALLLLGLLAITVRKERWYILEPLSLVAVFIVFFSWFDRFYHSEDFVLTLFFLTVFWLLFHASDLAREIFGSSRFTGFRHVTQSLCALLSYSALYILLWEHHRDMLGSGAFVLAILYTVSMIGIRAVFNGGSQTAARYGLIAASLALLGTGLEFSSTTTLRLWALEGLVLFAVGSKETKVFLSVAAMGFFLFSLFGFLFSEHSLVFEPIAEFALFSTPRVVTAGILAAALGGATLLAAKFPNPRMPAVRPVLGIVFFLVVFILCTAEANDFFRHEIHATRAGHANESVAEQVSTLLNLRQLSISGVWLFYSALTMAIGIARSAKGPRFFAIGLFGLTILKIFIVDLAFLETLYRVFSFMALGLILLAVSYAYQRFKAILFESDSSK